MIKLMKNYLKIGRESKNNVLSLFTTVVFAFTLILVGQVAGHDGLRFSNIEWGDSPEQVINKITAANLGGAKMCISDFTKKPELQGIAVIINGFIDNEYYHKLYSEVGKAGRIDLHNPGKVPYVTSVKLIGKKGGPVKAGTFYFDLIDNKLLAYQLQASDSCSSKEQDDRSDRKPGDPTPASYSQIYRVLEEKYGKPEPIGRYEKWTSGGERLYYFCHGGLYMTYINTQMVDNFLAYVKGEKTKELAVVKQTKTEGLLKEISSNGFSYGKLSHNTTIDTLGNTLEKSAASSGAKLKVMSSLKNLTRLPLVKTFYDKSVAPDDLKVLLSRPKADLTGIQDDTLIDSDSYLEVEVAGDDFSVVKKGFLYFSSVTGKLVVTRLYLKESCTDSESNDLTNRNRNSNATKKCAYSSGYEVLTKIHGKEPIIVGSYSARWQKENEDAVYYACYSGMNMTMLVFANLAGLDEHYQLFNQKVAAYREKTDPQKIGALKKVF
jgi:hypothetical protein